MKNLSESVECEERANYCVACGELGAIYGSVCGRCVESMLEPAEEVAHAA